MRIKRHKNVTAAILELEGLFRSRGNVEKQLGGPEESKGVSLAKRSDAGGKRGGPALGVARFIVIRKRIFDDYSGICWKERGVGRNTELVSDGRQGDRCNKRAAAGRRDSDALQMRLAFVVLFAMGNPAQAIVAVAAAQIYVSHVRRLIANYLC